MGQEGNVSSDLIWEIARTTNSYLVKRKSGGRFQFSRDPLNLVNKHSKKYSGFVDNKAIGIQPGPTGGVILIKKKTKHLNRPKSNKDQISWSAKKSGPQIYKGIVNHTTKQGYRPDLRQEAVARASAIRLSQRPKKDLPEKKPRGAKARAASAKKS